MVTEEDFASATHELEDYLQENAGVVQDATKKATVHGGSIQAVLVYMALMIWFYVVTQLSTFDQNWLDVGRMNAGQVMEGQYWRVITALTLHLDIGHIASNLVFGAVFGVLAGRILGGGVASLAILFAGSLGNFINAMIQQPEHSSVGASTAVFGALGVIVAHALRPLVFRQPSHPVSAFKRWSPLIGGLVLLGFTGVDGPRTDVAAHATGFIAGLVVGSAGASLPTHRLASSTVQVSAGIITLIILAVAWAFGFAN